MGNSNLEPIFDALKHGAVDYMNKPSRNSSKMRTIHAELISKIKSVARAKPQAALSKGKPVATSKRKKKSNGKFEIIVIGASTGGPTAIEQVISQLPADFDIPIIICQHMPAVFIPPFVNRLKWSYKVDSSVCIHFNTT